MKHFKIVMLDSSIRDSHPLKEKLSMRAGISTTTSIIWSDDFSEKLLYSSDDFVTRRVILGAFEGQWLLTDACYFIVVEALVLGSVEKFFFLLVLIWVCISVLDELFCFWELKGWFILLSLEVVALQGSFLLEWNFHWGCFLVLRSSLVEITLGSILDGLYLLQVVLFQVTTH